ncbi:MAG TPA: TetR/AcrR family transcriptional regulator [Chloroflexota bacterium]|nr:TetR/AcrR family transcriptional regulator [Chloroflexota bacterium]
MPRTRAAEPGLEDASRDRLRRAATEAFAERGYHGTTTREIAARGGLSPAGLYVHHESKAELLELVVMGAHEELIRQLEAADHTWGASSGSLERLAALIRAHVAFHASHQASARVANNELRALEGEALRRVLAARSRIEAMIQSAVEQCLAEGLLVVEDLRLTVFGVLSLSIGVARWFRSDGARSPDDIGRLYASMVLRMLGAPEERVQELRRAGRVLAAGSAAGGTESPAPSAAGPRSDGYDEVREVTS